MHYLSKSGGEKKGDFKGKSFPLNILRLRKFNDLEKSCKRLMTRVVFGKERIGRAGADGTARGSLPVNEIKLSQVDKEVIAVKKNEMYASII